MTNSERPPRRPARFGGSQRFDRVEGGTDPAQVTRLAHDTAWTLVSRVRQHADPAVLERLVRYTDEHGIDAIAELWATSGPRTLPGALWRVYVLRMLIAHTADELTYEYRCGVDELPTADALIAGAATPTGPAEMQQLADEILTGVFAGDLALALDRAAAFCRVVQAGAVAIANDSDLVAPARGSRLTEQAARMQDLADEFGSAARLWRLGSLT